MSAFFCEGCGSQVFTFPVHQVPERQLCLTCTWCCDHYIKNQSVEEFWKLYCWCNPNVLRKEEDVRSLREYFTAGGQPGPGDNEDHGHDGTVRSHDPGMGPD